MPVNYKTIFAAGVTAIALVLGVLYAVGGSTPAETAQLLYTLEESEELRIEGATFDGVDVMIYRPKRGPSDGDTTSGDSERGTPAVVFFHGGGWMMFDRATHNQSMSYIAKQTGFLVISVHYSLAPLYHFPQNIDDCVRATKFVLKNHRQLGADPERVAVGGNSAGGNLAAAVALKLRDERVSPGVKLQLLICAPLQAVDFLLPSYVQNQNNEQLPRTHMVHMWSMYAGGSNEYAKSMMNNEHVSSEVRTRMAETFVNHDNIPTAFRYAPYEKPSDIAGGQPGVSKDLTRTVLDLYCSPLLADDLSNLPPTFILTAQFDILRDDGLLYAARLQKAGVEVTHHNAERAHHKSFNAWHGNSESEDCLASVVDYLTAKL